MAEPETEATPKKPRNFDDYIKLAYGGVAAVATPVVGSVFSTAGTRIATFAGAIISGGIVMFLSRADKHVRTHAKKIHIKGTNWKVSEKTLKRLGIGVAVAVGSAAVVIGLTTIVEASTGKTLHGLETGNRSYGTTFGGSGTTPPTPQPSTSVTAPSATPSAATTAPTASSVPTITTSPSATIQASTTPTELAPSVPSTTIPATIAPTSSAQIIAPVPQPSATP